jgi:hypothetical protein
MRPVDDGFRTGLDRLLTVDNNDRRVLVGVEQKYGGNVSALSAGAYTTTLFVMKDIQYSERGWACAPHPDQPRQIFPT